jgi:lysyl-tRNA synthetase class 1
MAEERSPETVQNVVYEIGKTTGFEPLRDGSRRFMKSRSARSKVRGFGSFAALFGCAETAVLIRTALSGAFGSG